MIIFETFAKLVGTETKQQQYENFKSKTAKEQQKIVLQKRVDLLYKYNINFENNQIHCGLVGLENVGNTCHVNSVLQVFFNTIPLSKMLIERQSWKKQINPYSQYSQGQFVCAYFVLLKKIWESHDCFICPIQFCKTLQNERIINLKKHKKNMPLLIDKFINFLSQDLNKNITQQNEIVLQKDNIQDTLAQNLIWFNQVLKSPMNKIFYGQTVFEYTCKSCNNKNFQIDNFFKLNPRVNIRNNYDFTAYLITLCNGQKIFEVDFLIDPQSTLEDAVQHVLLQSGKDQNLQNFELFFYLNFYENEQIKNLKDIKLKDIHEKKRVLFIVETCCNGLKEKFQFKEQDQDLITLSIKVFHKNRMINVEQILKFKKNISQKELYDLFVYLYQDQIWNDKKHGFGRHYFETEDALKCIDIYIEGKKVTEDVTLESRSKKYCIDIKLNEKIFTKKINFKKADTLNLPNKVKAQDIKIPLFSIIDEQLQQMPNQNCSKCKKNMDQNWQFGYLPQILIIDINRFQKSQSCYYEKNDFFIDFPVKNFTLKSNFEGKIIDVKYHLYAVINMYGGKNDHTDTYCWSNKQKKWFKYNDRNVKEIKSKTIVSKNAAALFYERVKQFQGFMMLFYILKNFQLSTIILIIWIF